MVQTCGDQIEAALRSAADSEQKAALSRFFKTAPGQYGGGDEFWGIKVPVQREIVRRFRDKASLEDAARLLDSPVHECRLTGLLLLVSLFGRAASESGRKDAVELYQGRFHRVNNWDLVDSSAPYLTGPWYFERDRRPLITWAGSDHLWTQRISIMTTFYFIRQGDFSTTLELADKLLDHPHDLIHKAVGWMLREVGNRNLAEEEEFLLGLRDGRPRYQLMPRTMLRYAVEKFEKGRYREYLERRA